MNIRAKRIWLVFLLYAQEYDFSNMLIQQIASDNSRIRIWMAWNGCEQHSNVVFWNFTIKFLKI
jgi:hypothetical protein